jgi:cyclase
VPNLEAIGRAGGDGIRTIVSTHHHGDHTNGNSVAPSATIVGHELCRQAMLEAGTILRLDALGLVEPVDWGDIDLAPPFVTFSDRLTCYSGDLRIELAHFGTPAHTTNDVVAFVPEHRLLFSGDLTFNGVTPFFAMGSGTGLLAALERIRALDPTVIVPGHGEVCGPEVLAPIEAYIRFVQSCARDGVASGASPLDVARETDLGQFGELIDPERFVGNLHREYAELEGLEPGGAIDLVAMFGDMVTMNGDRPLHCVA